MTPLRPDLLAAVLAAPDDDVPRLLYADWWEENGQEERGEFIRVQLRIAAGGNYAKGHTVCHHDERCNRCCKCDGCQLSRRERELFVSAGPGQVEWFGPYHSIAALSSSVADHLPWFHRGFIESVTLSWADWQTHHAALRAAAPLRRVRLTTWPEWETNEPSDLRLHGMDRWHDIRFRARRPGHARAEIMTDLLAAEWPGITFELPPSVTG